MHDHNDIQQNRGEFDEPNPPGLHVAMSQWKTGKERIGIFIQFI